ncbi:Common plant regulatory factor 1 like [Actinidia chinensis var. chinensis]|uniref:Common plant regulatory factor 1 like n=1 Tax=Actinidia chinensis var. chinensis TaxID=1590841 RepID=A0A2R6QP30_ACTCC|nr:Common plant regulatory factor 1 like [Actinidia chinensis var. chinensis]
MGNSEETKPSKPEKTSSPPPDQANVHIYPDWAAMQAYYGPRVAVPPYFNSAVAPGHAPHPYMWGPPQPMMPPYVAPYAAIYAHGGVYAHPGVPVATTPNMEAPTISSGNTDQGLLKKLKGFDGLAMSIGNGSADSAEGGANNAHSQSEETEGSSDGSSGNTAGVGQNGRKRSREETTVTGGENGNTKSQKSPVPSGEVNGGSDKVMGVNAGATTALELRNPPNANANATQPSAMIPNETWLQNERELKRERRKQSNRESARRSRLRKQAEAEELAIRVDALTAENTTLKTEISRLKENSEKLKLENTTLVEKLKNAQGGLTKEVILTKLDDKRVPVGTENLLSRVNNSGSVDRSNEGGQSYENNSNSGVKLRQLLGPNPRADVLAAG